MLDRKPYSVDNQMDSLKQRLDIDAQLSIQNIGRREALFIYINIKM